MFRGDMLRVVQLRHAERGRAVAVVEEPNLRLLSGVGSVYRLAVSAIESNRKLTQAAERELSSQSIGYEEVHAGRSDWRLLPPFGHADEPNRCLVTGTG